MFHHASFVDAPALSNAGPPPPPPPSMPLMHLDLSRIPPHLREAALEYDSFLSQLTFNSKDVITNLTRIAGENLMASDAIVAAIEQRAMLAQPQAKLPFLYLLDSIVKNIGADYIPRFAINLFHTFTNCYAVAPPQVRMSMHRLLNTWPAIFGLESVTAMRRTAADHDAMSVAQAPVAPPRPVSHVLRMPPIQQPQPPAFGFSNPQNPAPALRQPPPRIAPQAPPTHQLAMSVAPQAAQHQFPPQQAVAPPLLRSQPSLPAAVTPSAEVIPPSPEFLQAQSMMQDISRKASMGHHPSNHQLFTMNRLLTTQLQKSPPPPIRAALVRFQQQLREISAAPRQTQPRPPPQSTYPSSTTMPVKIPPVVPPNVSAALSGLLRSMPPGLLSTAHQQASVAAPLPPPTHPRRAAPSQPPRQARLRASPPPQAAAVFQTPRRATLKFADLKTMSHAASVRALYTELPHLSKSDGMRFAAKEELRDHLDWLFKQNRRKQAQSQNVVIGGLSRCWYDGVERFVNEKDEVKAEGSNGGADVKNVNVNERNTGAGNGEADSAKDSIDAVESRGDNEICAACQEGFETFWDDDRHAWMLKGATRTDDGEIFHSKCVDLTDDVRHVEADDAAEAEESRDEDLLKSLAKQEDAVGETKASEADDDAGSDGENSKKRKREDVKADAEGIVKQEDMGIEEAREKRVKVEGGGVVGIAEVPGAGSVS